MPLSRLVISLSRIYRYVRAFCKFSWLGFLLFIYVLGFFGGRKENGKWGEKVINYVMRQANEIYYGSQAQNLSFISSINIKNSEEICLFYFISFFSLRFAGNKLFFLSFLLFIIVIILIYVVRIFYWSSEHFFNAPF